jgi:hypothetical protein
LAKQRLSRLPRILCSIVARWEVLLVFAMINLILPYVKIADWNLLWYVELLARYTRLARP